MCICTRKPEWKSVGAYEIDNVWPAARDRGLENSSMIPSAAFVVRVAGVLAPIRIVWWPDRSLRDFTSSFPEAQWIDKVWPLRLMLPKPDAVTQGARKSPGTAGRTARDLLAASGLKPVAASIVAQLLMARE